MLSVPQLLAESTTKQIPQNSFDDFNPTVAATFHLLHWKSICVFGFNFVFFLTCTPHSFNMFVTVGEMVQKDAKILWVIVVYAGVLLPDWLSNCGLNRNGAWQEVTKQRFSDEARRMSNNTQYGSSLNHLQLTQDHRQCHGSSELPGTLGF